MNKYFKIINIFIIFSFIFQPLLSLAQADFNPNFIISDQELQDNGGWGTLEIQKFLQSKSSYLANYQSESVSGTIKSAAQIIYDAAQAYQINPKFLLVTLQKEQSLITDDAPTQKQLDWATGYAVCDSCSLEDPQVVKHKGFGKQVDDAAGVMRWYYDNKNKTYIKQKDTPIRIDDVDVTPQNWATAFLYTYTPHIHGNRNFWRIWSTWFEQFYPNGTLVISASSSEYFLIQNGQRRKFASQSALVSRVDPRLAIKVDDISLSNYPLGPDIAFSNYSILQTPSGIYLLDYDTLRPFASEEVVRKLGYNPQEVIEATDADLASYPRGAIITVSSTAPRGVIYQITDLPNVFYLLKDDQFYPLADKKIIDTNYKSLPVEKHKKKDLAAYPIADILPTFQDGSLIKTDDSNKIYVIDNGKKRPISDTETFLALGYKKNNVVSVKLSSLLPIPVGEPLYLNPSLLSARDKFLGDSLAPAKDLFGKTQSASYLVAEFPSGRVISGKNIDTALPIASLTKLLTGYEALNQNFNLAGAIAFDKNKYADLTTSAKGLQYQKGEKLKAKDVFYAMLVASHNLSARMVALNSGLSEADFVDKINYRLSEWGADSTKITDVTGWDEQNQSTARDLLKIFTKVYANSTIADALAQTAYNFRGMVAKKSYLHKLTTTNSIISLYPFSRRSYKILASKTGYTDEAQSMMIMLIEAKKTKKQYLVITMGNPNYKKRFEEPHKIADWIATAKVEIAGAKITK